ncbi:MAG: hypothetical protein ACOYK7_09770 [Pirellulales bacterium]
MRVGLLGYDDSIGWLLDAARGSGHTLGPVCDVDPAVLEALPGAMPAAWETLLDAESSAAVLVGADGWHPGRADAVRALVQAGRTLVLSHPLDLSMVWAYELEMIRQDTGSRLVPFLPERLHPFVEQLRATLESALAGAGTIGVPETLLFERQLADRGRDAVLRAFARDADLIRAIVGSPGRLSTLGGGGGGPGPEDALWGSLAIGLSGPTSLPVRWQAGRGSPPGLRVRLLGSRGDVALEIPDGQRVNCRLERGTTPTQQPLDRPAAMLAELERIIAQPAAHPSPPKAPRAIPPATWDDAARAIELAETVPRSLARGRGIDLHQEEFTDVGTFKGTMASVGCGLVLVGLLVVLLGALIGGIARENGWELVAQVAGAWPMVLLVILCAFLGLQILPLLIGGAPRRGDDSGPGDLPGA